MATMMYHNQSATLTKSQSMRTKRKSAVELLAESKPFYVKSEIVRDTTQAIPMRLSAAASNNTMMVPPTMGPLIYPSYSRSKSMSVTQHGTYYRPTTLPQYVAVSPSRSLPPLSHRRSMHLGTNDVLQNKLRQLLVCDISAEELSVEQLAPLSPPAEYAAQRCHKSLPDLHCRNNEPSSNKSSNKSLSNRDSGGSSGHYTQRSEPAPPPPQEIRRDSGSSTQHSGGSSYYCCQEPECRARQQQPPPFPPSSASSSAFKRQKCLRYNKRDRPILRSKSDISDRYWRPPEQQQPQPQGPPTSHLEQFFEHLGMTSDSYEEMLSTSRSSDSPVFFSDVSTVDSGKPIDNVEYCQSSAYRPSEPPSIVERNARIIKWLCNCRKSQLT